MRAWDSEGVGGAKEYRIEDADWREIVQKEDAGADKDVFEARVVYHDCCCCGLWDLMRVLLSRPQYQVGAIVFVPSP